MQKRKTTKHLFVIIITMCLILTACGDNLKTSQDAYQNEKTEPEKEKQEDSAADINIKFEPKVVTDIAEIRKMRLWLEYFYYNNIFDENLNNETGEISEDAMMSFATSYIMQIENKGLRFDVDTFRLYIPKKTLEEVVLRFFDHKIEKHRSLSKHGILFDEDNYVIQANAREWPTRLDVINITEVKPKVYVAILNGNNTEAGEVEHQVKAEFELLEDRPVLKKYQMITDKAAFVTGNPIDTDNSEEPAPNGEGTDNIANPDESKSFVESEFKE